MIQIIISSFGSPKRKIHHTAETAINTIQDNIQAKSDEVDRRTGMASNEESRIKEAKFISTVELVEESDTQMNSVPFPKASSSQANEVATISQKSVTTKIQMTFDVPDYDTLSRRLEEATEKIDELEDALRKKGELVAQLRNKLTNYGLREVRNQLATDDKPYHSKEESSAQGQEQTEVSHKGSLSIIEEI